MQAQQVALEYSRLKLNTICHIQLELQEGRPYHVGDLLADGSVAGQRPIEEHGDVCTGGILDRGYVALPGVEMAEDLGQALRDGEKALSIRHQLFEAIQDGVWNSTADAWMRPEVRITQTIEIRYC